VHPLCGAPQWLGGLFQWTLRIPLRVRIQAVQWDVYPQQLLLPGDLFGGLPQLQRDVSLQHQRQFLWFVVFGLPRARQWCRHLQRIDLRCGVFGGVQVVPWGVHSLDVALLATALPD
jgi:hypothetical protein